MDLSPVRYFTSDLIDESIPTPLYHQIYVVLRERIVSGELAEGVTLPSEKEMSRQFGVSRITARRALTELAARGLVRRQRAKGTTVSGGALIPLVASSFETVLDSLERMEHQTDLELLEVGEEACSAKVAARLEIDLDAPVMRAVRLRRLASEPFSHLVTYIPIDIARRYSKAELASTSMITLLERAGTIVEETDQWITAVRGGAAVAAAFEVSPDEPLLKIDLVMRGPNRRPVQFIEVHYRPDRFQFHVRTKRRTTT